MMKVAKGWVVMRRWRIKEVEKLEIEGVEWTMEEDGVWTVKREE